MGSHLIGTGRHLPYGITQTCYPTKRYKKGNSSCVQRIKSGELRSTNDLELHVSLVLFGPTKMHIFWETIFHSPIGGLRPHIFYTR